MILALKSEENEGKIATCILIPTTHACARHCKHLLAKAGDALCKYVSWFLSRTRFL